MVINCFGSIRDAVIGKVDLTTTIVLIFEKGSSRISHSFIFSGQSETESKIEKEIASFIEEKTGKKINSVNMKLISNLLVHNLN